MKNSQFKLLIVLHSATLFLVGMLFIKLTPNNNPAQLESHSHIKNSAKGIENSSKGIPLSSSSLVQNIEYSQNFIYGQEDAPNELIIFSNYTCGFCKQFYNQNFKTLNETYIQTGKLKVVFIFNGSPLNKTGALMTKVAEVARLHNQYPMIQDQFYDEDFDLDSINIVNQLVEMGVKNSAIKEKLNGNELSDFIKNQLALGRKHSINGTPIFFLNNIKWEGYLKKDDFWNFFNENLKVGTLFKTSALQ